MTQSIVRFFRIVSKTASRVKWNARIPYELFVKLQSVLNSNEEFKRHCQNQVIALREDFEALRKYVNVSNVQNSSAIQADPDNDSRKMAPEDFDTFASHVSFPNCILDDIETGPIKIVDFTYTNAQKQKSIYEVLCSQFQCEVISFYQQNDMTDSIILGQSATISIIKEVSQNSGNRTRALDSIEDLNGCDILKIDARNTKPVILMDGIRLLQNVSIICIEIEFKYLTEGCPNFSDIDKFVRDQGFFLQSLAKPIILGVKHGDSTSNLIRMDAIYIKDLAIIERLKPEKILKTAIISHIVLRNQELTAKVLEVFDRQTGHKSVVSYLDFLGKKRLIFDKLRQKVQRKD